MSDSLIDRPDDAPSLYGLEQQWMEHPMDPMGPAVCPVPEPEVAPDELDFERFMQQVSSLLDALLPHENQWDSVDAALYYLLKAFMTKGSDRLLWNITAIEAVLGEKVEGGLTKLLRRRICRILGRTNAERKDVGKHFDELYGLRSDLVHGNAQLSALHGGHLRNARMFARDVVSWMLHFLKHVADTASDQSASIPSREQLLLWLDMDPGTRSQAIRSLASLPVEFPFVEQWLRNG